MMKKTIIFLISMLIFPTLTLAEPEVTKKILFKNNTPYQFYFKDKSTSETWEIKPLSYEVINLHQNFYNPEKIVIFKDDEEISDSDKTDDTITNTIEFPHQTTIWYKDNNSEIYLNNCMNTSPDKNTIIQVFLGNSGVNCYTSEYNT